MAALFRRWLVVGIALFAMLACTPIVAPGAVDTPEVAATPAPQSEQTPATPEAEEETMAPQPANNEVAALAAEDLAARLSVPVEQIQVREVRAVTWPDASLGCPQPGMMYAQVTQDGLLIRLSVGEEMYFYHSGSNQKPFLCEQLSEVIPNMTPKVDELLPPPGRDID
jgi:hypothetical protein